MNYSEWKEKILVLKAYGFTKDKGQPFYKREYDLMGLKKQIMISITEIEHHRYLDKFLRWKTQDIAEEFKRQTKGKHSRFNKKVKGK